jgi:hypothetical protein
VKHHALFVMLLAASCGRHPTRQVSADAGVQTQPVDRLLVSELARSKLLVFGFPIPQGMTVSRRFSDSVHMVGSVSPDALTAFVKAHAVTGPAELIGSRKVFSKVKIRGGDPSRLYDIEIDNSGSLQQLIVSDITPPPLEPGLSVEERWRRAGYKPDGTPLASSQAM